MTRTDRIQIEYRLVFSAPFHCGTGVRIGLIDRSVMRDSGEYLYVPGSTIKGVVRELCEQLARFYEDSDQELRKRMADPHNKTLALGDLGATQTLITRIFGSQIHAGQLYFNDARQSKADKERYDVEGARQGDEKAIKRYQEMQTDSYTQVRLNRLTRTAERGALYSSEFGVKEMAFEGSIVGALTRIPISPEVDEAFADEAFADKENGPTYSLLLLLAGLYMLERLGGNKSTGKGECRCEITQLTINDVVHIPDTKTKQSPLWEDWLQHLDVLSYYSLMLEEGV